MKFLRPRGTKYQFERPVPKDIQKTVGFKSWRESLKTDSKIEAEIKCRRRTVETDDIIQQVRDQTYRHFTDDELDDLAIRWSLDFQHINRENIAKDAFPGVFCRRTQDW